MEINEEDNENWFLEKQTRVAEEKKWAYMEIEEKE